MWLFGDTATDKGMDLQFLSAALHQWEPGLPQGLAMKKGDSYVREEFEEQLSSARQCVVALEVWKTDFLFTHTPVFSFIFVFTMQDSQVKKTIKNLLQNIMLVYIYSNEFATIIWQFQFVIHYFVWFLMR